MQYLLLDLFIVSSIFGSANDLIISYSVQRCFSNFTAKHIITNNPIFTLLIYPSFLISYKDLWISLYLFSLQVGLPNVGKSTFFNIVTKLSIPAENFPFCTIDPNEARVYVPDERFDWLCQLYKPKSEVSAYLEINDIAGLVRGAHAGEGLGNAFLSHIRAVDGIFHVLIITDRKSVV